MGLISILVNLIVLLIILALVYVILKMILEALGMGQFVKIALAIVLLIGLLWFLSMIGLISGGGPIVVVG